jgi:hypothetical protein
LKWPLDTTGTFVLLSNPQPNTTHTPWTTNAL